METIYVAIPRDCMFEPSGFETKAMVFGKEEKREEFLKDNNDWMHV